MGEAVSGASAPPHQAHGHGVGSLQLSEMTPRRQSQPSSGVRSSSDVGGEGLPDHAPDAGLHGEIARLRAENAQLKHEAEQSNAMMVRLQVELCYLRSALEGLQQSIIDRAAQPAECQALAASSSSAAAAKAAAAAAVAVAEAAASPAELRPAALTTPVGVPGTIGSIPLLQAAFAAPVAVPVAAPFISPLQAAAYTGSGGADAPGFQVSRIRWAAIVSGRLSLMPLHLSCSRRWRCHLRLYMLPAHMRQRWRL